jgi:large subunit ribosomal protein L10
MPKNKIQKKQIIEELIEKIKKSKSIIFVSFNGLGVIENEELRKALSASNGEYYVSKKTLLNLAFKDYNYDKLDIKSLEGQIATVFSYGDEIAPVKAIKDFKKGKEEKIKFLGGILDNKYIFEKDVEVLSLIPSKNELYAKVVGSLNAPISGFVNVLAGNIKNFIYVLKAIEEKKA